MPAAFEDFYACTGTAEPHPWSAPAVLRSTLRLQR